MPIRQTMIVPLDRIAAMFGSLATVSGIKEGSTSVLVMHADFTWSFTQRSGAIHRSLPSVLDCFLLRHQKKSRVSKRSCRPRAWWWQTAIVDSPALCLRAYDGAGCPAEAGIAELVNQRKKGKKKSFSYCRNRSAITEIDGGITIALACRRQDSQAHTQYLVPVSHTHPARPAKPISAPSGPAHTPSDSCCSPACAHYCHASAPSAGSQG